MKRSPWSSTPGEPARGSICGTARVSLASFLAMVAASPCARAQGIETIVLEGDVLPGIGTVQRINGMAVSDTGEVLVHVITDNPILEEDAAMIDRHGMVAVRESDALAEPPGAVISHFAGGEIAMNGAGTPAFLIGFTGATGPGTNGLYVGVPPVLALREKSTVTATGVPAGWFYDFLLAAVVNSAEELAFSARIEETSTGNEHLAIFRMSTVTGTVETVVQVGDTLPKQSDPVTGLAIDAHEYSINDAGQVFYSIQTSAAVGRNNALYIDDTRVAQEGDPSPIGGVYATLSQLNMNNVGTHVFICSSGAIDGIVRNDEAFVETGQTLPGMEPYVIDQFGQPIFIGDNGRVLWLAVWAAPGQPESVALHADYSVLVQEGATSLEGLVVEDLTALDRSCAMSANGRYVVFEAILAGGIEGAFLVDLGA